MKKFAPFLFLLLFSGCTHFMFGQNEVTSSGGYAPAPEYAPVDTMTRSMNLKDSNSGSTMISGTGYTAEQDQKVIKTGTLSLHVENVRDSIEAIKAKVTEWGGDVSNSNLNRADNSYYASMTVRVPSDQFDAALAGLKAMAVYVESEDTNSDNITEAYMDLQARLNNLKEEEKQYLAILDKAVTVDEILQVTDYLSNVRYEIESAEGQMKYYDSNVDYSTITLSLSEDESVESAKETWRPQSTFHEALSDWVLFLQKAADSAIYLAIFGWPLLILVGVAIIWSRTHRKKRK